MNITETRPNEFEQLRRWITTPHQSDRQLHLIGISGYGGIGKTYLLNMALQDLKPEESMQKMVLTINGADPAILGNFAAMLERGFAPAQLSPPAKIGEYFPRTRRLIQKHADVAQRFHKELEKKAASADMKELLKSLFDTGIAMNDVFGKTQEYVDFKHLREKGIEQELGDGLKALEAFTSLDTSTWMPGLLKDLFGLRFSERLTTDLFGLAADCLGGDYAEALSSYSNFQGLLLIIDDFEILGKTLTEFIVGKFAKMLQTAHFKTIMIILGRDDICDIDPAFNRNLGQQMLGRLRLEPFSEEVACALLVEKGYSEADARRLYRQTRGYPFLITALADREENVGYYQNFFLRTTQWMTREETEWLLPLCYLDEVNEDSIRAMLPPHVNAAAVMDWFAQEASVRDLGQRVYCVNPLIREMLFEYHRRRIGEKQQKEWIAKGKQAVAASRE